MEHTHCVLTIRAEHAVSMRLSDGRTAVEPHDTARIAWAWVSGFCAAAHMAGWTVEFIGE